MSRGLIPISAIAYSLTYNAEQCQRFFLKSKETHITSLWLSRKLCHSCVTRGSGDTVDFLIGNPIDYHTSQCYMFDF